MLGITVLLLEIFFMSHPFNRISKPVVLITWKPQEYHFRLTGRKLCGFFEKSNLKVLRFHQSYNKSTIYMHFKVAIHTTNHH